MPGCLLLSPGFQVLPEIDDTAKEEEGQIVGDNGYSCLPSGNKHHLRRCGKSSRRGFCAIKKATYKIHDLARKPTVPQSALLQSLRTPKRD